MQKIGESTNTANPSGEFTEGNPVGGIPATLLRAPWLNTVQRELVGLVLGAGIQLNAADDGQVLKAVKELAAGAANFNKISNLPTTLGGYGITDAYTKGQIDSSLLSKASKATTLDGYGITDAYTKGQIDSSLLSKASKATTLDGYGITDAYTKGQIDSSLLSKASKATTLDGYGITDAYTKGQIDSSLLSKASKATTLAGYGITDAYTKAQIDSSLLSKASKATTLAGYEITDAYDKAQIDSSFNAKLSKTGGTCTGGVVISVTGQDVTSAALHLNNPAAGGTVVLRLSTQSTATAWMHTQNTNIMAARNAAGNAADLDVGSVTSNGSLCHTAASFMKPVAGQFVVLQGTATLPAGGSWAYYVGAYNGSGNILGGNAGIAAGGTTVGQNSNSVGFAWRIY